MYKVSAQQALVKFARTRLMRELISGALGSKDIARAGLGLRRAPGSVVGDALTKSVVQARRQSMHPSMARLLQRRASDVPTYRQLGSLAPGTLRPTGQQAIRTFTPRVRTPDVFMPTMYAG